MREFAEQHDIMQQPRRALVSVYRAYRIMLPTPLLRWYIKHGLQVTRIYRVLQYKPKSWLDDVGQDIIWWRRESDRNTLLEVIAALKKLFGNALYGKTTTDKTRHTNVRYCNDKNVQRLINDPLFRQCEQLAPGCYEVLMAKGKIVYDLPNIMAFFVYAYAKLSMLEFVYDFMDEFVDESKYQLLQMDTDSLYMAIAGDTVRDLVPPDRLEEFDDASPHYLEDKEKFPEYVRRPCIMKVEMESAEEMVCLNSKMYIAYKAATADRKEVIKRASKGLQHNTNPLEVAHYRDVLQTKLPYTGRNRGFRTIGGNIYQYSQQRSAVSYFYCKRIVHPDGVTTSPVKLKG